VRRYEITVVPMQLSWGAETYLDRLGISTEDALNRMRSSGVCPTVDAPDVDDFSRTYRLLRESCDGVISIHLSSKLSDAVINAGIAREGFGPIGQGGPFPVAVVDSLSVSMGLGWIVLEVAKAAERGLDLQHLVGLANRLTELSHVAFFTEQTEILLKSGRAGRLASQAEALTTLRPLFHLDEGNVAVYDKTRTRPKARDSLYNFVEDFTAIGELAIVHSNITQNDVEHLLTRVGAIYPRERVPIIQISAALAAWLGPDVLGVAVLEGEE
jgi:DegV family protein with EDD domain